MMLRLKYDVSTPVSQKNQHHCHILIYFFFLLLQIYNKNSNIETTAVISSRENSWYSYWMANEKILLKTDD